MNIIAFLLIKLMIDYEYVKNIYFGYRYIEGENLIVSKVIPYRFKF